MFDDTEIKAAKAEAEAARAEAATSKAEAESLRAEKTKLDDEYKKLKGKDMNFRRLESMTQEEKDALTEKELELQKRQETLEDEVSSHRKSVRDDWRTSAIERASQGDAEKAKAITAALDDVAGEDKDRASIEARVAKAVKLARKDDAIDHLGSAFSFNAPPPEKGEAKGYGESEEGQSLAKRLGMGFVKK